MNRKTKVKIRFFQIFLVGILAIVLNGTYGNATDERYEQRKGINSVELEYPIDLSVFDLQKFKQQTENYEIVTVKVKNGSSLSAIFSARNSSNVLKDLLRNRAVKKILSPLKANTQIQFFYGNASKKLEKVNYIINANHQYSFNLTGNGIKIEKSNQKFEPKKFKTEVHYSSGSINSSFYQDAVNVGVPKNIIYLITQLFAWDIDFVNDIQKGDSFEVIYEKIIHKGEYVRSGKVLWAQFNANNQEYQSYNFEHPNGYRGYYNEKGLSLRKRFIRTPVDFQRITAKFSFSRYHPILKKRRPHKGVDFGAARGSKIYAAGRGVIQKAYYSKSYGNMVIIDHGDGYTTLYAHMQRFRKGIRQGRKIEQGDVIGYVGTTGLSTGPHLHYEFRYKGKHKNPLKMVLPNTKPIPGNYMANFKNYKNKIANYYKKFTRRAFLELKSNKAEL